MGITFLSFFWVFKRVRELSRLFSVINVRSTEPEKNKKKKKMPLQTSFSFKNLVLDKENLSRTNGDGFYEFVVNPRPYGELDAAALTIQKFYKSYRTRRNLADCAVVVEELWWKALDFAALKRSSVSFFHNDKPESAVSRWGRACTRVAKVGKGLSKDKKSTKTSDLPLARSYRPTASLWTQPTIILQCLVYKSKFTTLLLLYKCITKIFDNEIPSNAFIYTILWYFRLDVGDGKEISVEKCPRNILQSQCIKYLGPKEREEYEVIIENGKLLYKQSRRFVKTIEGTKWIFVLSTSRTLYVGQKKKGLFQHSSFLAGAATTAAGRMVVHDGVLEAIWPYSGHYHPTEENFKEFICFLEEHQVDLTNVKKCPLDDDDPFLSVTCEEKSKSSSTRGKPSIKVQPFNEERLSKEIVNVHCEKMGIRELGNVKSPRWTSGAGPRIGCVRDYPTKLQFQALEQLNLSPRKVTFVNGTMFSSNGPIPSPRPSPCVHLSPRLANMGRNHERNA